MVRISERTSEIRTHANGGSGRVGVKGQDERQTTAPLTPTRPLRELARSFCLTAEEAVIHGAPSFISCRSPRSSPPDAPPGNIPTSYAPSACPYPWHRP